MAIAVFVDGGSKGWGEMGEGQGGCEGKGEGNKAARAARAKEGKRASTRAAKGDKGSRAAIGVIRMVVAAFDGGGGNCNLCQRRRQGGRVTWARANKCTRVRARADKGRGHKDNKREGGMGAGLTG